MHSLPHTPSVLNTKSKFLFLLLGPLKVLFQIAVLWWTLGYKSKKARWLIVQNPPSIPTLLLAYIISSCRGTSLLIDWHNFGYTLLGLKIGLRHPLVLLSRFYEVHLARCATAHICVSNAMARVLVRDYHIPSKTITVLHDRPASDFQPLSSSQRFALLHRLPETSPHASAIENNRIRLLVSSTSWSPDEDFSLLLDALVQYSHLAITTHPYLPEILAIITGKGPLKESYLAKIQDLQTADKLEMVHIKTAWLSTSDYACLLASADLGVSLHKSSSGLDLPMKVVDMFGVGLPVLGWSAFEAWPELVQEGVNGKGFESVEELVKGLVGLFGNENAHDRAAHPGELDRLKEGAIREGKRRWEGEWDGKMVEVLGLGS